MTEEEQEAELEASTSADAFMKGFDGLDEGSSVLSGFDILTMLLEIR